MTDTNGTNGSSAVGLRPEQVTLESSFRGKVYAITGGSSGMGFSVALALASFGAYVSFCGRNKERLAKNEAEVASLSHYGRDGVLSYSLDLVDEDAVDAWIQATVDKFGKLDGAVNAAALEAPEAVPITEMKTSTWHTVINANLTGVFNCMRSELKRMERGAVIVNVASILSKVGLEANAPYTASKHGVLGLTRAVAKEYGPKGIRINATSPGHTWTAMLENATNRLKASGREMVDVTAHTIQKRVSHAHEQAQPVLFMLSDWSSFISGENLSVDGGWTC
ncbi:NAD(P)-binding protein [Cryphonectria parasitica EP155]|uniref:NAD(P)-binding protein n=1 Tax=Cryphonectria parasitica (strain ATCC 38755 / EP155) TaxID=660469 RepID=A0A9P4Y9Y6_CRYP1|nr:NAD(P)-binding protein [Cryphonectria parasitica EP155]KAF3769657.1 NAD(P)-binding protein [Cryphonectria parasitica EP155]